MTENYKRAWDGKEWETFSLLLVRLRHGHTNVQPIPDRVKGDLGLECITTDGCCYQSYAPMEAADVAKAASSMKAKANKDLNKLQSNAKEIERLLQGRKIERWVMLCPFLDDKAVLQSVATKAAELRKLGLNILADDFEALVHAQDEFSQEIDTIRQQALGTSLDLLVPTKEAVEEAENNLDQTLDDKLKRGFPDLNNTSRRKRKRGFLSTQIRADNALEQLKRDAPELWERATTAIALEEDRLLTAGTIDGSSPGKIILGEQDRLFGSLRAELPTISSNSVRAIATGQIGTWLIECPLDFEDADKTGS